MNPDQKEYHTTRLIIRPTILEDAEFIFKLMNSPKWIKYIGDRKVYSVEEAEKYIQEKMLPQLERLGHSNNTIILKDSKEKIGTCGLFDREGLEGLDIGFSLLPQYEKLGYGYEAAQKLMEVAKDIFKVDKIKAITTKDNYASQKLLEKIGLKNTGVVNLPNDPEELLLYEN